MPTPVEVSYLSKEAAASVADIWTYAASGQLWSMSRRAFGGSSGTYNVRASELARQRRVKVVCCTVFFLDDSQQTFEINKRGKGQVLFDFVFQHLELVEKDYFGLQYAEISHSRDAMRWLDPCKSIRKQLKNGPPYLLYFRVKFYVSDPSKLQEEYTRYHFFLQLKRDILEGRLVVPHATSALLASYAVQSELGDFNPEEHRNGYLSELRLVPNQMEDIERKVMELHKMHKGQMPADAEYNYLDHAKRLDMYGVDLHKARVRDSTNAEIQLGVTSAGLVVFQNNIKINTFSWAKIIKISFKRKQFYIQLRREGTESYDSMLGFNMLSYRSCKNLWKTCVEHHTFFRLHTPRLPPKRLFFNLGSRFRYSGRTEYQTLEEGKRKARTERSFIRSPSKRYARQTMPTLEPREKKPSKPVGKTNGTTIQPVRPYDSFSHKIQVTEPEYKPRKAWIETPSPVETAFTPSLPPKMLGYMDEETAELYDLPTTYVPEPSVIRPYPVVIKMFADENGRFGFNVKGGSDQGMPILVSRVAPGTPAAHCIPKLMEGDEIININGSDITRLTHEQVVMLIRTAGETGNRELKLQVYPTTLYGNRSDIYGTPVKEPDFLYIPAFPQKLGPYCDELVASILMLVENMETSALELQYQKVERRMPNLTSDVAERLENRSSNRYSDVLPYDSTRVVLLKGLTSDYINANYVNMEIPSLAIINRYIAMQGPLQRTTGDFWQMVWEQASSLILMLTQLKEGNYCKCYQYWPDNLCSNTYGRFKVTSIREVLDKETMSFMIREFLIFNTETGESREVTHMQYLNWPDYGVPNVDCDFIKFVVQVRKEKAGIVEPVVIHCSAGVGRTGVFVLVDTALCLIEANEPVYPHEILRAMRKWRPLLVQNFQQYKFACQIILRCFNEESVVPLPEYRR